MYEINLSKKKLIMNKIAILLFFFLAFITLNAQIVNEGTLKIESGTSVYFVDNYTNKVGATHTNDGDLHLEANFTNNGTTTIPTSGTTYFDGSTVDTQTIDGVTEEIHFYNLTVNNTHASVKGLAVSDLYNLQVENDVALTSGDLRLMGEAQLIQKHTGVSANTGLGHLLKDQDGAQNAYRYNYWSSPVQVSSGDNVVANFLKDGTTPNLWAPATPSFIAGYNGAVGSPISLAAFWFYKYVDGVVDPYNTQDWVPLFSGTTPLAGGAVMLPGQGYTMKGTSTGALYAATQNYTFNGKPNDGDYSLNISPNKEYLVGNPYPSAIDADLFIAENAGRIDGTLYYWHHWGTDTHVYANYSAGYAMYNLSGSGTGTASTLHPDFTGGSGPGGLAFTPQQEIAVGQGFIVRADNGASGGVVNFKNNQRIFSLGSVKNSSKSTNGVTARIRLDYQAPSERLRHLLLAFTDGTATSSFDFGYDGKVIDQWPDDLYFIMGDTDAELSIPYSIQGVGTFNIDAEYPLVVKTATSGKHTIMIDELEYFNEDLYILDEKGNTHDLRDGNYEFYTNTNETERNLKLVFKPASTSADVQDNLNEFISAYYVKDEIIVKNDKKLILTGLQVYNMLGQLVLQIQDKNRLSDTIVHIPFSNFAHSGYVIKVQAETGNGTYKFINY